jgi:hypothetical protein
VWDQGSGIKRGRIRIGLISDVGSDEDVVEARIVRVDPEGDRQADP